MERLQRSRGAIIRSNEICNQIDDDCNSKSTTGFPLRSVSGLRRVGGDITNVTQRCYQPTGMVANGEDEKF